MHKVQADYVNAKMKLDLCLIAHARLIKPQAGKELDVDSIMEAKRLIKECDAAYDIARINLVEWAAESCPIFKFIAEKVMREPDEMNWKSQEEEIKFVDTLCEHAMRIPVVTRGETG